MLAKTVYAVDLKEIYTPAKALGDNPTIFGLLNPIINNVLIVSGIFALLVIIFSGFNLISASGDKTKITQAQSMLTYAIVGLVVIASAFLITNLVMQLIGYNEFK